MGKLRFISIDELKIHEAIDELQVLRIVASISETGKFGPPLLVDDNTEVILDGHHRYWAGRRSGCQRLPCYCVDYQTDEDVVLRSWRPDVTVTKEKVVAMGLSEGIFPQKTTRHVYQMPEFEPTPIEELV